MSTKVAKSIGISYKLNRFLPETIHKTSYTLLIHPYLSYTERISCIIFQEFGSF